MLAGLVPLLLGVLLLVVQQRAAAAAQSRLSAQDRAKSVAALLTATFGDWRTELLTASQNAVLRQWYTDRTDRPALRTDLDAALVQLYQLYPDLIDEACFIDASGAEQGRQVHGVGAKAVDLSPDESGNPFFHPTIALSSGRVYQASPYLSPDSHRWVISNSTPILVAGRTVAILHFETNLDGLRARLHSMLAAGQAARVVDTRTGRVLVDTVSATTLADRPLPGVADRPLPAGWTDASASVTGTSDNANRWRVDVAIKGTPGMTGTERDRLLLVVGIALLVLAFGAARFSRSLVLPIRRVGIMAKALAEGDLTVRMNTHRRDEIGDMAESLDLAAEAIARTIGELAKESTALAVAASGLSAVSVGMSDSARQAAAQSARVAAVAVDVAESVGTVSAGTREMGSAIGEIARSATHVSGVSSDASTAAERAGATVVRLAESSTRIQDIVKTVTAIADQTKLLALNATIEAARAGAAGQGFAVVAHEVKELAVQTALATEDIGERISAIQSDAQRAGGAIDEITELIRLINGMQLTVAGAVEEQSVTIGDMDRNAGHATAGSATITESIREVADATAHTTIGAERVAGSATELATLAAGLHMLVGRFHYETARADPTAGAEPTLDSSPPDTSG